MALIQIASAFFLYLAFVLQQDVPPALGAAVYAAVVTWPLLALFAEKREQHAWSVTLIYLAVGLSWPGLVWLAAAAVHLPRVPTFAVCLAALYAVAVFQLFRQRGTLDQPSARVERQPRQPATLIALGLCFVGLAPTLVYAIYMGRGAYPAMFFNADNPYHLSHVWSMLHDPTYPVMSLCVFGERRIYQYGGQAAASILSALSGIQPHAAYLGVLFPVYKIAAVAAAWKLGERLSPGAPLWMTAGTLAVVSRFPIDVQELRVTWALATGEWPTPSPMNLFDIDHVLTQFGMFSALLIAAYVAGNRERTLQFPTVASLSMLPVFKMSFFLGLGSAFGGWLALRAARARSVQPLVAGFIALAAALLLVRVLSLTSGDTSGQLVLSPFAHLKDLLAPVVMKINGAFGEPSVALTLRGLRMIATEYAYGFHWLIVSLLAVALACRRPLPRGWAEWCVMALAPIVFMNVVKYTRGTVDNESIRSSIDVTFTLVPYLVLAASLALVSAAWPGVSGTRRRLVYSVYIAYVGFFVATNVGAVITLLAVPSAGYEHADNRSIAAALKSIPAEALIVTNDTRYPATNFAARDLQMQIPSIFGHHAYFVDAVNDRFEGSDARRVKQELLRETTWRPELPEVARAEGWTHFLVRRDYPHPGNVPLKLVFENGEYRVYQF